jgi:hypothetical protein
MKITKLIIIFVLIMFPIFIANNINLEHNRQNLITEMRYNRAIDTAVQDAARALITNASQQKETNYEFKKKLRINKEAGVQTFFNTMYMNFGVFNDPVGQGVIDSYVPVVVVVGYDGYYFYSKGPYTNATGQTEYKHVWSPKKPYAYADQYGNTLSFTLDDYVTVNRNSDQRWIEGFRGEIASTAGVPLLNSPDTFDQVRRITIVNAIQKDLEQFTNEYNNYTKKIGVAYTFTLPLISQEEWDNTINDVGVLAFVQGMPMGAKHYNNYALGGSRIVKTPQYNGIIANGQKYYYSRKSCTSAFAPTEVFKSEKDAAKSGYIPLDCTVGYRN